MIGNGGCAPLGLHRCCLGVVAVVGDRGGGCVTIVTGDSTRCGNTIVGDGNKIVAVVEGGRCTGSDGCSGCGTTILKITMFFKLTMRSI